MENHEQGKPAGEAPKTDRRIQRTRHLLREALIALILEKGYDAITVQDILDRANMGRSTFYAHYRDKEDLLLSGFHALFESFRKEYRQASAPGTDLVQEGREISLFFFRHASTHHGLFKAMIGEQGGKVIQDHLLKYMTRTIREHLTASGQKNIPADLLAHYIASSYLTLLSWWLDHDMPFSAEQMDAYFQQLVFPGIRELMVTK